MANHCWVCLRVAFVPALFVFYFGAGIPVSVCRQQSAQPNTTSANTRACTANPVLAPAAKQKGHRQSKNHSSPGPLPVCIEIQGEALEIQEVFQSIAREKQWRIHESHATEDSWTFVRYLNTDELYNFADTSVLIQPVNFEDGKAAVVVRTVDIGSGFVRIQVSAQFEGEGKSADKTMKQPATTWPLTTKGVMEKEMLAALEARYQHLE